MRYFIDKVEVTEDVFNQAQATNFYDFKVIGYEKVSLMSNEETKKNFLRNKRKPILIAFDAYKSSVAFGTEVETPEQHEEIVLWYDDLKKLKESAFENIPERVAYYIQP